MKLTYEITENGYIILNNGKPWIVQDEYIPYQAETLEESAELHIAELMKTDDIKERPTLQDVMDNQLVLMDAIGTLYEDVMSI